MTELRFHPSASLDKLPTYFVLSRTTTLFITKPIGYLYANIHDFEADGLFCFEVCVSQGG